MGEIGGASEPVLTASRARRLRAPEIRKSRRHVMRVVLSFFVVLLFVAGCGGGGGNETPGDRQPTARTATGQFKDANVAGLSYVSGGQSGITDSEGRFIYEVGETVTFSVGNVQLGEAIEGKSVVTPVDLIEQGSSSSEPVTNIARLLQALDQDADPSNGIIISQDVQIRAQDWTLDVNSNDFDQQLESIKSDLEQEYESFSGFPDEATARDHLEATFRCSYSGAYIGTYGGTDQGEFGILIDARNGDASGIAYSTEQYEYITLTGTRSISYDQNVAFASGSTSEGTEFNGKFTSVDTVEGQWGYRFDPSIGGSFSGERIGGVQYAAYRATGTWRTDSFDEYGIFTFDINDSGRITGFAYNIAYDISGNLNGSLSGTNISATASDGTRIAGTLNRETGVLRGRFNDSAGFSGTFEGNGCRLN